MPRADNHAFRIAPALLRPGIHQGGRLIAPFRLGYAFLFAEPVAESGRIKPGNSHLWIHFGPRALGEKRVLHNQRQLVVKKVSLEQISGDFRAGDVEIVFHICLVKGFVGAAVFLVFRGSDPCHTLGDADECQAFPGQIPGLFFRWRASRQDPCLHLLQFLIEPPLAQQPLCCAVASGILVRFVIQQQGLGKRGACGRVNLPLLEGSQRQQKSASDGQFLFPCQAFSQDARIKVGFRQGVENLRPKAWILAGF